MLQGLYLYEVILMIAGGILFLALVFLLIWNSIKGKSITSLLPFFLIPIIMIGWSTIKSISYSNGTVEIQKTADSLAKAPADTSLQIKLEKSVAAFDTTRAANDPVALNAISNAYYALGKYEDATRYNQMALAINPNLQQAVTLKTHIEKQVTIKNNFNKSISQLNTCLATLKASKGQANPATTQQIIDTLKNLKQPVYTDATSSLTIAKALAAVDKKEQSMQIVQKVLEADPKSQETLQVKQNIQAGKYTPAVTDSAQTKSLDTKKFNFIIKKPVPVKH
jgi:tetratricopeptide (TPR) repeat protein